MQEFEGRVAVVTGGGSGIGEALSRACSARGMKVVVVDVEESAAKRVVDGIQAGGGDAFPAVVDVRHRAELERLAREVDERYGGCHLLCNNAGVLVTRPVLELEEKDWAWTLAVNLMGPIHAVSVFLPGMIASGEPGHVVNTASIAGLVALPQMDLGAYTTSKFALVGYSEYLRADLAAQGIPIGVSVVCPGAVETRIAESERNRPGELDTGQGGKTSVADPGGPGVAGLQNPRAAAERILAGVERDEAWILTHPEMKGLVEKRSGALSTAFDAAAALSPGQPGVRD
ncbi:MAG: SDR family NAD(P)-dependent oxidoreductase [Myxococcota bacterium]|nr:SDR family NAD(P)-dependent oxidoreductase [Myxococcota bacterium]